MLPTVDPVTGVAGTLWPNTDGELIEGEDADGPPVVTAATRAVEPVVLVVPAVVLVAVAPLAIPEEGDHLPFHVARVSGVALT